MSDLTIEDLELLIEAVEVWAYKPASDGAFADVVGAVLTRPDEQASFEAKMRERVSKREVDVKLRKERGFVLAAKLVSLKDSLIAASLLNSTANSNVTGAYEAKRVGFEGK